MCGKHFIVNKINKVRNNRNNSTFARKFKVLKVNFDAVLNLISTRLMT